MTDLSFMLTHRYALDFRVLELETSLHSGIVAFNFKQSDTCLYEFKTPLDTYGGTLCLLPDDMNVSDPNSLISDELNIYVLDKKDLRAVSYCKVLLHPDKNNSESYNFITSLKVLCTAKFETIMNHAKGVHTRSGSIKGEVSVCLLPRRPVPQPAVIPEPSVDHIECGEGELDDITILPPPLPISPHDAIEEHFSPKPSPEVPLARPLRHFLEVDPSDHIRDVQMEYVPGFRLPLRTMASQSPPRRRSRPRWSTASLSPPRRSQDPGLRCSACLLLSGERCPTHETRTSSFANTSRLVRTPEESPSARTRGRAEARYSNAPSPIQPVTRAPTHRGVNGTTTKRRPPRGDTLNTSSKNSIKSTQRTTQRIDNRTRVRVGARTQSGQPHKVSEESHRRGTLNTQRNTKRPVSRGGPHQNRALVGSRKPEETTTPMRARKKNIDTTIRGKNQNTPPLVNRERQSSTCSSPRSKGHPSLSPHDSRSPKNKSLRRSSQDQVDLPAYEGKVEAITRAHDNDPPLLHIIHDQCDPPLPAPTPGSNDTSPDDSQVADRSGKDQSYPLPIEESDGFIFYHHTG